MVYQRNEEELTDVSEVNNTDIKEELVLECSVNFWKHPGNSSGLQIVSICVILSIIAVPSNTWISNASEINVVLSVYDNNNTLST